MLFNVRNRNFELELIFSAARSGGPGGQSVNKVNTKVELRFNIPDSELLSIEEKERLLDKLSAKITNNGELIIVSQASRSQTKNKEKAVKRFYTTLEKALQKPKKRKPTKPTRAAQEKRIEEKKKQAQKKSRRQDPFKE